MRSNVGWTGTTMADRTKPSTISCRLIFDDLNNYCSWLDFWGPRDNACRQAGGAGGGHQELRDCRLDASHEQRRLPRPCRRQHTHSPSTVEHVRALDLSPNHPFYTEPVHGRAVLWRYV